MIWSKKGKKCLPCTLRRCILGVVDEDSTEGGGRVTESQGATHKRAAVAPRFPSFYEIGLMILADQCPPDGKFYMCWMGCAGELEDVCADCWRHYMHYVASAGMSDPYRADRRRDDL